MRNLPHTNQTRATIRPRTHRRQATLHRPTMPPMQPLRRRTQRTLRTNNVTSYPHVENSQANPHNPHPGAPKATPRQTAGEVALMCGGFRVFRRRAPCGSSFNDFSVLCSRKDLAAFLADVVACSLAHEDFFCERWVCASGVCFIFGVTGSAVIVCSHARIIGKGVHCG